MPPDLIIFYCVLCVLVLVAVGNIIYGYVKSDLRFAHARKVFGLLLLVGTLSFSAVTLPGRIRSPVKARESEVKSNVHTIQIALHRWALENEGLYPEKINQLKNDVIITQYPFNPFSEEEMIPVDFGSGNFEGNFTYIPVFDEENDEIAIGYYLIAYGYRETEGQDIDSDGVPDHVILVLSSHEDDETILPDLSELLRRE